MTFRGATEAMMITYMLIMTAHASAQVLAAKPVDKQQSQEVVVTAKKMALSTVTREARHITRTVDDEVSHFETPVCPAVVGLSPAYNIVIERRIEAAAAMANIKLARDGCTPNLLVMLSGKPSALLQTLDHKQPGFLSRCLFMMWNAFCNPAVLHGAGNPRNRNGGTALLSST